MTGPTAAADRAAPGPVTGSVDRAAQAAPSIELAGQTPAVGRGGTWSVRVRTEGVPTDSYLRFVVHPRIASAPAFAATLDGGSLGNAIFSSSGVVLSTLATDATGARTASLTLARAGGSPEVAGAIALTPGRTYPVEVRVETASAVLASLLTYMVVLPDDPATGAPLAVAVVADLSSAPHLEPDGQVRLTDAEVSATAAAAGALAASSTPATLAVTPELLEVLPTSQAGLAALDALRGAAQGREVLSRPYVDVSPAALAAAGLGHELTALLDRGDDLLGSELGLPPDHGAWLARPGSLSASGLRLLRAEGTTGLVVAAEDLVTSARQVDPTRTLSLEVDDGSDATVEAAVPATEVTALLEGDDEPALRAQRAVASLAVTWRDRAAAGRGVVLVVDPRDDPEVVTALLDQLDAPGILRPTTLGDLLDTVEVDTDPSGEPIPAELAPAQVSDPIGLRLAARLGSAQDALAGFTSMVGPDDPRVHPYGRHLAVALADGLGARTRQAHLDVVLAESERLASTVELPEGGRVTLTARSGTVPLTLRRTTDHPVTVRVELESSRLEFPDGHDLTVVLDEEITRIDIAVRVFGSGAFPLDVSVTSPDGSLALDRTRFTVQSTAVSGVGLVLSIGAGAFLALWWAAHWRRARRSRRLVPRHASQD
ncbi:MAG: DUF6049 family protein [Acidimicrobiia bacterium]